MENEVKKVVDDIQKSFHDFKEANDKLILDTKSDILQELKVDKINDHISDLEEKMEKIIASQSAPKQIESEGNEALSDYKSAFVSYLRNGNSSGLKDLERKSLSVGTDTDGGFLITPEMTGIIEGIFTETSPMESIASVQSISTDSLELPIRVTNAATATKSEKGSVSETDTFELALKTIPTHEIYAEPAITQKMLDDADINIEGYLANEVATRLAEKKNAAYVSGAGVSGAKGFLSNTAASPALGSDQVQFILSGSDGSFDGDDIIDLFYTLKDKYVNNNTRFVMPRAAEKILRKLKEGSSNEYIYSFDSVGKVGMAMGIPIVRFDDMTDPAADSLSVAVGDFNQGYQVVNRVGLRTIRDDVTSKGFIKYYTTTRYGGDVKVAEAIKVLKLGTS
jgi:HK97 family phage major capsid protein